MLNEENPFHTMTSCLIILGMVQILPRRDELDTYKLSSSGSRRSHLVERPPGDPRIGANRTAFGGRASADIRARDRALYLTVPILKEARYARDADRQYCDELPKYHRTLQLGLKLPMAPGLTITIEYH